MHFVSGDGDAERIVEPRSATRFTSRQPSGESVVRAHLGPAAWTIERGIRCAQVVVVGHIWRLSPDERPSHTL